MKLWSLLPRTFKFSVFWILCEIQKEKAFGTVYLVPEPRVPTHLLTRSLIGDSSLDIARDNECFLIERLVQYGEWHSQIPATSGVSHWGWGIYRGAKGCYKYTVGPPHALTGKKMQTRSPLRLNQGLITLPTTAQRVVVRAPPIFFSLLASAIFAAFALIWTPPLPLQTLSSLGKIVNEVSSVSTKRLSTKRCEHLIVKGHWIFVEGNRRWNR